MATFVLFSFHYPNTGPSSGEHRLSNRISPDSGENVLKGEPRRNCVYLIVSVCMTGTLEGLVKVLLPLLNFSQSLPLLQEVLEHAVVQEAERKGFPFP